MQDVDNKEDTELSREDLTLSWRELPVEFLGHCQSVGNWMFFSAIACQTKGFPGSLPCVPWPQQLTGPFPKTACFSLLPPSAIRIRQCTPLPRGHLGRTRGARTSGTVSAILQISGLQGRLSILIRDMAAYGSISTLDSISVLFQVSS